MSEYGFEVEDLTKYFEGIINHQDENGIVDGPVLVYFKFKYNISTKEAAQLLIQRLTGLLEECDKYGL